MFFQLKNTMHHNNKHTLRINKCQILTYLKIASTNALDGCKVKRKL